MAINISCFLFSREWNREVDFLDRYMANMTQINHSNLTYPEKIAALTNLSFRHERLIQERLVESKSLIGT